jgi:hypothetical protein
MQQGFNFSASGKVTLAEMEAFYINTANWLASAPDFSLTAKLKHHNVFILSVTPLNGFNGRVALSCSSANSEVSCELDPISILSTGSSTLRVASDVGGIFEVTVTGRSGSLAHGLIVGGFGRGKQ